MSGEGGGLIIGGAVMLAVAPVVIAGAAVIGVAYGTLKVGSVLTKRAFDYAKEKKRENELVVSQCSMQLDSLYSGMRIAIGEETKANANYMEQMAKQFNVIGSDLQMAKNEHLSAVELDRKIEKSRVQLLEKLKEHDTHIKDVLAKGNIQIGECITAIEKTNAQKADLVDWVNASVATKAMQKAAAEEMLRDAEASIRLIKSMADSSKDEIFKKKVANVTKTFTNSKKAWDLQMFESAFSTARTVIRESAILAGEHVQEEMEMDMLEMQLCARLEGLYEEMKAQREIEFCDETKKIKKKKKADLNTFSQGVYKKTMENIEEELSQVRKNSGKSTVYEMRQLMNKLERELEPEARDVIERSKKVMVGYYERVHVLEVVADFMKEQNYTMDWVMPVGGDASQKLVVHFVQNVTKNTISVTLENDIQSDDIAKMAMEVLTFYGNGREVTEEEKRELREQLTNAIHKAGFKGMLSCTGQVNQPSARIEMNEKEKVRKMPVKPVL